MQNLKIKVVLQSVGILVVYQASLCFLILRASTWAVECTKSMLDELLCLATAQVMYDPDQVLKRRNKGGGQASWKNELPGFVMNLPLFFSVCLSGPLYKSEILQFHHVQASHELGLFYFFLLGNVAFQMQMVLLGSVNVFDGGFH